MIFRVCVCICVSVRACISVCVCVCVLVSVCLSIHIYMLVVALVLKHVVKALTKIVRCFGCLLLTLYQLYIKFWSDVKCVVLL